MTAETCLFVTKEFSATPTSGGQLRTLALVDMLTARYETTIVSPDGIDVRGPSSSLRRVASAPPSGRWWTVLRRYRSISGARIGDTRLVEQLDRLHGSFAVAVIDHTCLAGLAPDVARRAGRVVVSMHNVESDLMAQRSAASSARAEKVTMALETRLLRRLEATVIASDTVVVTTEADARALGRGRDVVVCRNGIFPTPADLEDDAGRKPLSMVFSGALDWGPNVDGLLWFLEHAWAGVREQVPGATITIAGRNPSDAIVAACTRPGVVLVANPPEMAPLLAEHGLGVVPLLSGGGSRIKILEYLDAGLDIVSTDVGASGLEDIPDTLIDRLPADPRAFATQIARRLLSPHATGPQARRWVREHYAWEVTLRPLQDSLAVAVPDPRSPTTGRTTP